jgi:hypothetical protein
VHPLIDSSFRNNAGEKKAIEFVQERSRVQQEALEKARLEFEKYHVEAQNLLIAYIGLDQNLLRTQTDKEIAIQQQEQYKQQANAEEQRIAVQEKKARADKQPQVIDAKLSIDIATDNAQALRKQAEGIRDSTMTKATGDAFQNREVGKGIADAYNAQADAIGRANLAVIQVLKEVSAGNIKITPDMLITGDAGTGNLFSAWLATMLSNQGTAKTPIEEKKVKTKNVSPMLIPSLQTSMASSSIITPREEQNREESNNTMQEKNSSTSPVSSPYMPGDSEPKSFKYLADETEQELDKRPVRKRPTRGR